MRNRVQTLAASCVLVLALVAGSSATAMAQDGPLTLMTGIPVTSVNGGDFDHFDVDFKHDRLFVTAEVNATIEVFRLSTGEHLLSLKGIAASPHKLVYVPDKNQLFIADAKSASCKIVDASDYRVIKRIPLEPQPDSGVYDPDARIFYIGNGGRDPHPDRSYISMINVDTGNVVGRVEIPASQLKAMVLDRKQHKLYVNLRDKLEVAVVDLQRKTLAATWSVPGPSRNSAMAYDPDHHRLFIGSRKPGKLYVLDARDGRVVDTLDVVDTSDDMTYDPIHRRLYISGSDGVDVVSQNDADHYAVIQHMDTHGGKTSIYLPTLHKFYVVHTKGEQAAEAGLQIFDVK